MTLDQVIQQGIRADQPAATAVPPGTLYSVTDEAYVLERSDGAVWVQYAPAGGGDVTHTGTLASGALLAGNGGSDITTVDLSGAVTTSGSGVTSVGTIPGRLVGLRVFTTPGSGTYSPTSGTTSIVMELIGGGGGGAGVAQPGGSSWNLGAGGVGGGWLLKRLTSNFSGASYTVGAKGSGGAAGAHDGAAGTDTTFTDTAGSPTTYTAQGGTGGGRNGAFTAPFLCGVPSVDATTGGDLVMDGATGSVPICLNANNGYGGSGGASRYSLGARAATNGSTNAGSNGNHATGYGGGGGGACAQGTSGDKSGGDGSDGLIIVWEYA